MTNTGTPPGPARPTGRVEIRPATPLPQDEPPPSNPLDAHLDHFHSRVLQDALLEATSRYWLRRADQFAAVGTEACDLIATNCRRHAQLLQDSGLDTEAQFALTLIRAEVVS